MKEAEIICLDHPHMDTHSLGDINALKLNDKCNWLVFDLREERFYPRKPDQEEGHTYQTWTGHVTYRR